MTADAGIPRIHQIETIVLDQHERHIAIIGGAVWPRTGSVIELGDPNRDAIVKDVRLMLTPSRASIVIRVIELDEGDTVEPPTSD